MKKSVLNFNLKQLLLCLSVILIASCNSSESDENFIKIKDTTWNIDYLLCLDDDIEHYTLTGINESKEYQLGNFVTFQNATDFVSFNIAPCGNDCFTTVFGKYRLVSKTEISFSIDSITYEGTCSQPTKYGIEEILRFDVVKADKENSLELFVKK
jgi:hypothetical protein